MLAEQQNLLTLGAVLMLLNTAWDVGKGILSFPILENHGKQAALVYLAALIIQGVLLNMGCSSSWRWLPSARYST